MRKILVVISLALSSVAHAESSKPQLFECMDTKSFEVNSQCIANKIGNDWRFKDAQNQIVRSAEDNSSNAMASVSFYPELRLIEVVAHRDATYAKAMQLHE